jgi:hypothetical protein
MAREKHIDPVKNMSLYHCTVQDFVLFMTSLTANLCKALPSQNTTENNFIISEAQNTTVLQPNVFLTETHCVLVTNNGQSSFPSPNHFQGQIKTPQSVTVKHDSVVRSEAIILVPI